MWVNLGLAIIALGILGGITMGGLNADAHGVRWLATTACLVGVAFLGAGLRLADPSKSDARPCHQETVVAAAGATRGHVADAFTTERFTIEICQIADDFWYRGKTLPMATQ